MDGPSARVRQWLQRTVVGLELCPYARGPIESGRLRLVVAEGDLEARLSALWLEAERLVATDPREVETTLVVLPDAPSGFDAFLDDSELATQLVERAAGDALQVIAFHPRFCFADSDPDDPANRTNRSPVALWHLLREESVSRAVAADPEGLAALPARNRDLLRRLSSEIVDG